MSRRRSCRQQVLKERLCCFDGQTLGNRRLGSDDGRGALGQDERLDELRGIVVIESGRAATVHEHERQMAPGRLPAKRVGTEHVLHRPFESQSEVEEWTEFLLSLPHRHGCEPVAVEVNDVGSLCLRSDHTGPRPVCGVTEAVLRLPTMSFVTCSTCSFAKSRLLL